MNFLYYFFPYIYGGFSVSSDTLYTFSILLLLAAIIISTVAQIKIKTSFNKYSKVQSPINGEQAARSLLETEGISGINIERCKGNLTDHFDPRNNTIYLSETVYDAYNIAAVGVACHEAGHAVQHATGYKPIKLRNAIIPVTKIGSSLAMPLVFLGLIFSFYPLAVLGVIFFGASLVFQLITLPVEFNASRRAIVTVKQNLYLSNQADTKGISKVLTAAALTYVGAMLVSLANFLRLLAIVNRRR